MVQQSLGLRGIQGSPCKDADAPSGCPIDFERLGELRANSRVRSNGFGGH
jgi:hypothetical protein